LAEYVALPERYKALKQVEFKLGKAYAPKESLPNCESVSTRRPGQYSTSLRRCLQIYCGGR